MFSQLMEKSHVHIVENALLKMVLEEVKRRFGAAFSVVA